ncbi:putative ABC-type uncharacterized transport system involved in gliding motility auxiliary component-like protein [Candidatus Zixiibacteriota bacterium]|nr:putative ABC-type uncharacterized transport system involved in gliding motility auxiliary component-like protein [candidate division Zixibacteria bacterium]
MKLFASKVIKTKSSAGVLILIIAAILLVINLISINLFSRVDLTDNKIYSLSQTSKDLVGGLTDRLNIKVFFTDDLPAPHNNDARYLKDLLDDYKAYSHGYLHYEFIDPVKADREKEVQGYRIPPLQFNVFRNDKTEFIKGYKGLVLLYGDKQEVLPFIENTDNLEYDLSSAIKRLISKEMPSIAFTSGHEEPSLSKGLQWAYQMLQKEYKVQFLDLKNQKSIPQDINVLFIISPKQPFSEYEKYLVDQYLMRGGRVVFLVDRFNIDLNQAIATPINTGLDSLMINYGFGIKDSLAIDAQCNMIPVIRQMGQYQMQSIVKYPFFIAISDFNPKITIVKDFKSLGMAFISPIDISMPVPSDERREILFSSSEHSGLVGYPADITPERKFQAEDFNRSTLPLGVVISGTLHSFFENRSIPPYQGTDTINTSRPPEPVYSTSDGRIIAIGNGTFIDDDNRSNQTGFALLLNMADWMTQDKGLIAIRSKQVGSRILEETSDSTKTIVKYINMFAMPFAVILFGLIRWQFKRARRRKVL